MHKYIAMAALAALLAGCGQKDQSALSEVPAMPAPTATVASPANEAPASASTSAAPVEESRREAPRKGLGPKHAFNAGVNIMMARDVCKLPAGDIAKFSAYSKWLVGDDQEMRKAYLLGAQKTAELHRVLAKKNELPTLEKKVCPGVKDMLTVISRGIKTVKPIIGQMPITQ